MLQIRQKLGAFIVEKWTEDKCAYQVQMAYIICKWTHQEVCLRMYRFDVMFKFLVQRRQSVETIERYASIYMKLKTQNLKIMNYKRRIECKFEHLWEILEMIPDSYLNFSYTKM